MTDPMVSRSANGEDSSDHILRDPLEELAAEFAERYRNGDEVTVEQYALAHPDLADGIRELFPTIAAMERLNTRRVMEAAMLDGSRPRQLGDYRIVDEIARGGMGIVYEAEQISLGRRVAVKVLPSHALSREKDVRRFQREAQTAAGLHHSNIVPVFGVGEDNGQHYIVMQLIRGVGLDEVLNEVKRAFVDGGSAGDSNTTADRFSAIVRSAANLVDSELHAQSTRVSANAETQETPIDQRPPRTPTPVALRASLGRDYFRNVAKIGLQAAEALHYAHQQDTLHRDIKPGNLILDEDGRVWIADFGLAKAIHDNDVTRSDDIVGTIAYVAPERFQGTTTKSSDTYSLGVTLYEMLTLQKAFSGGDRVEVLNQVTTQGLVQPRKLHRSVPLDLETIVMKAAASEPRDRYSSAAALARDLEAFLEDRPIEARRLSYLEHGVRWCNRNRTLAGMACGMILLVATVIGLLAFGYRHSERQRARVERTYDRAMGVIDEIYDRFAPAPFAEAMHQDEVIDPLSETGTIEQMPISKDTAVLLENLLDVYDDLAEDSYASDQVAIKTISANRKLGDIHRRLDQLEDARSSYKEAIRRIEQVPPSLRGQVITRLETARAYNGLGLILRRKWRGSRDSLEAHRMAVDVLDAQSTSKQERFELATSLYLLHQAETSLKRRSRSRRKNQRDNGGVSSLSLARKILTNLKQEDPERPEYDLLLARCLLPVSLFDRSEVREVQPAIEILTSLLEQDPGDPDYQYELGRAYFSVYGRRHSSVEPSAEELAAAEEKLRYALDATFELELQHPNIPKYYLLKKLLNEALGNVLHRRGDLLNAARFYERAIESQRLLVMHAEVPDDHRPWLYLLQSDYATVLEESQQYERAKDLLLSTADQFESLVAAGDAGHHHQSDGNRRWRLDKLEKIRQALARVEERLAEANASESDARAH